MALFGPMPGDVLLHSVVSLLEPSDILNLSVTSKSANQLVSSRRQALLLSRHRLHSCLQSSRIRIEQRDAFVASQCKLPQLQLAELHQKLLLQLQASPDGIRDLAAAVQTALSLVTLQDQVPPSWLRVVKQDLIRVAHFVCLLAWRTHLRSRRAALQQEQQQQAADLQAHVVLEGEQGAGQAMQQGQHADAPPADQQQELLAEGDGIQQELAPPTPTNEHAVLPGAIEDHQQQQQPAAVLFASAGVQTELGPSLREVQELLAGVAALMTADNPSFRPCRATLQLLHRHLDLQLLAWNTLPGAVAAGGEVDVAEEDGEGIGAPEAEEAEEAVEAGPAEPTRAAAAGGGLEETGGPGLPAAVADEAVAAPVAVGETGNGTGLAEPSEAPAAEGRA